MTEAEHNKRMMEQFYFEQQAMIDSQAFPRMRKKLDSEPLQGIRVSLKKWLAEPASRSLERRMMII